MAQRSVFKSEEGKRAVLAAYDAVLQCWPVPCEAREIDTRHGRTFVIAWGDSALPPLFLIHGSGSNAAMWIGDAAEYSRHFRVYALDIPGEAGKSRDIRPNLHSAAHAEWLHDVFDALGVAKAAFTGISLGGWAALKFAAAYPDRVDKLVLLCPAGIGPRKLSPVFSLLLMKLKGRRSAEKAMRKVYEGADIPKEAVAYSMLISQNFNYYRGAMPRFSNAELARLTMPVLFIAGEKDAMLDMRSAAKRAQKHIPNVRIMLLPGAGHVLIDQRERIMPFLMGQNPPCHCGNCP